MPARSQAANLSTRHLLAPAARTATFSTGAGVDLAAFNAATVVFLTGTITDGTHTPKLQESSDNATWTDVAAADQIGAFTAVTSATGGNAVQEVAYVGAKRYLRIFVTVSGATTGGVYGADIVLGLPWSAPVA